MGDLRADRGRAEAPVPRKVRSLVCRVLGHVPVPDVDEWELVYVRCRSCRRDLTLDA
jgi:hypothetical protein